MPQMTLGQRLNARRGLTAGFAGRGVQADTRMKRGLRRPVGGGFGMGAYGKPKKKQPQLEHHQRRGGNRVYLPL